MGYNIVTDYKATGNKALDGAASCIIYHRKKNIALAAIYLKPLYYEWFKKGTEILLGRELEEGELMTMDGVNIELGSIFQSVAILPKLWSDHQRERKEILN